ncbi:helix-turn-helix domain-containing protein [Agrobacterium rubi]|uniref:XRE family transcriptional regulator n=1 Tax=Agrobacterium rubi TaxID=28099 RepID=A0AAE7R1J8_9HYPH|nr:helix-turn-helix domain-containing protein [Agrobacterium rubi]NTE85178.1 XRE family transcriptional regulator [Agrobacterium rubi]NTF01110.1 XRE family transcriptional regulator [Agrobacterium rubi]NTF35298.1 XRE family transcriptional regulator [Agrobacterium rubi]OCJ48686.1 DNA-binding protein [Agrobacterium rubi]QTG00500.1 XRE family transcriptional regulator [Agrobacterium rubi]
MENGTDTFERSIAERIKHLRTQGGLTLDQLASASGVSRAMISRIERGEASPTAALLARICAALGLSLSGFFAEDKQTISPLMRKDDQLTWKDPETGYTRRVISPPRVESDIDIVEVDFPAHARVSFPPHAASRGMTQYVWLLEGTLEMTTGGEVYQMAPGDCLFMPVGDGHIFHNPSDTAARYAVVLDQRKR